MAPGRPALLLLRWLRDLHDPFVRAVAAEIVFPQLRIFIFAQNNDGCALGAFCRLISRRIGQLVKIILVGAVPDVIFRHEAVPAFSALLPIAIMFFPVMMRAQRVMIMVSMTAVARVREHNVLVLVIADPILTAICLRQVSRLSAKTTAIFKYSFLGLLFCLRHGSFLFRLPTSARLKFPLRGLLGLYTQRPSILIPRCTFIYS